MSSELSYPYELPYPHKTYDAAELRGKTITSIYQEGENDRVIIATDDGAYLMNHNQECGENVEVHSIIGSLQSLVGSPLVVATEECITEESERPADMEKLDHLDSWTITIYRFETATEKVQIRWLGESNGYYGESVDINRIS